MKIVYYSGLQFADCDFPLVKAYQQAGEDVTYIIPLLCDKLNGPLLSIGNQIQKSDILQATDYEEFRKYSNCSKSSVRVQWGKASAQLVVSHAEGIVLQITRNR